MYDSDMFFSWKNFMKSICGIFIDMSFCKRLRQIRQVILGCFSLENLRNM